MTRSKIDVITFKVDGALRKALEGIPNRSEFIRAAILASLDSVCPLCNGTGILTANQRHHWNAFAHTHALEECAHCHERRIVCLSGAQSKSGRRRRVGGARGGRA